MGLFTALVTLPLAPVRGVVWVAERLEEQALDEMNDETGIQSALAELEAARESGEFDEAEIEAAEDALIVRLMELRGFKGGGTDGTVG
jgi:hypothetical protein